MEAKMLSEKILNYRAANDLSQVEFAKLCKVTQQTVCNLERCVQNPSRLTLKKILNIIEKE